MNVSEDQRALRNNMFTRSLRLIALGMLIETGAGAGGGSSSRITLRESEPGEKRGSNTHGTSNRPQEVLIDCLLRSKVVFLD